VEEIMRLSTQVDINGEILDVTPEHDEHRKQRVKELMGQKQFQPIDHHGAEDVGDDA
jgi:hypothetical protein